jgi:chromosome transmission fidelity protein 4
LITQVAFSPSQNLLAWADTGGILTWWRDPIPAGSPDPAKATAAGGAQGVSVKRKSTPTLWGDDPVNGDGVPGTVEDYGNDWIIDDIGIGMEDEHGEKRAVDVDGFVKEMGMFIDITCYSCSGLNW